MRWAANLHAKAQTHHAEKEGTVMTFMRRGVN